MKFEVTKGTMVMTQEKKTPQGAPDTLPEVSRRSTTPAVQASSRPWSSSRTAENLPDAYVPTRRSSCSMQRVSPPSVCAA